MKGFIDRSTIIVPLALVLLCAQQSGSFAQANPSPVGTLNQQKTELTLQFPNAPSAKITLNPTQVEQMIDMLAQMRAAMNPPRPMANPVAGATINVATAGRWHTQPDGTGIDLDVLHPGYGWVGIYVDRVSIEELNRTLSRSLRPVAVRAKHPSKRE
jgi:hypothetical protein